MSEKRDTEYFVLQFGEMIESNLNAQLDLINDRKNDGIVLAKVNKDAYYYLTFGAGIPAYDPCVIFGVDTEVVGSMSGHVAEKLLLTAELILSDKGDAATVNTLKRIIRYKRALREVVQAHRSEYPNLIVENLPDIRFVRDGSHFFAMGIGVQISYPL